MKSLRIYLFLLGAILVFARLQLFADPPPPASPPPAPAPAEEVSPPPPDTAPAGSAKISPTPPADSATASGADASNPKSELRDLTAPTAEDVPKIQVERDEREKSKPVRRVRSDTRGGRKEVMTFGDAYLPAGETGEVVVAVFGNALAYGPVQEVVVAVFGNSEAKEDVGEVVVAVFGNASAEKTVNQDVVAVMGDARVNGHVHGQVVAVFGTVWLGPRAEVDGDVVCVGGKVEQDPSAVVHGQIHSVPFLEHFPMLGTLGIWFRHAILEGRLLAPGQHLAWPWVLTFGFLGFYLLLSIAFGPTLTRCADTLDERPIKTLGAALLALVVAPALMLVLLVTLIGAAAVFFAVLVALLIGKAAFLAWLGRRFAKPLGLSHVTAQVLFGGVLVVVLYAIPVVGLLVWMIGSTLGLGMAVYTLILTTRRDRSARALPGQSSRSASPFPPPPPPIPPKPADETFAAASASSAAVANAFISPLPGTTTAEARSTATLPPPVLPVSSASLPRAGFWIRVAASLLDAVLVAVAAGLLHLGDLFLLLLTAYHITLWAKKGTTVGGIVCGLKVVRLDDRTIDWSVAVVRALGAFLSLCVAGLGFIWVAFDDDKQSWHDKIAGTTVVYVPKGVSLI